MRKKEGDREIKTELETQRQRKRVSERARERETDRDKGKLRPETIAFAISQRQDLGNVMM